MSPTWIHVFILTCFASLISTRGISYESALSWSSNRRSEVLVFQQLSHYNSSAILHFIELTTNFTDEELENCKRISLSSLNLTIPSTAYRQFDSQAEGARRGANFLTNIFSSDLHANRSLQNLIASKDFYWALLLANLQSNPAIFGAGIVFSNDFLSTSGARHLTALKQFSPYIFRSTSPSLTSLTNEIIKLNLASLSSSSSSSSSLSSGVGGGEGGEDTYEHFHSDWYFRLGLNNYERLVSQWREEALHGSDGLLSFASGLGLGSRNQRLDIQKATKGVWTSPFHDCNITKTWLAVYVVPFFARPLNAQPSDTPVGVMFVSIDLRPVDINQCEVEQTSFFADTHKCHRPSSECNNVPGVGFQRGAYYCKCRTGYYMPNASASRQSDDDDNWFPNIPAHHKGHFSGRSVERAFIDRVLSPIDVHDHHNFPKDYICMPCESGCDECQDLSPCLSPNDRSLRNIILFIQLFFILLVFCLSIAVFRSRYTKRIASSIWVLLQTTLLGSSILYSTVILRYYNASTITCFLEPWAREIGFSICYGSLLIKVYRIYAEFQTRKAHRVCVRDKDLLKYLAGIVLIVFGYMSAWTALVLDGRAERNLNSFTSFSEAWSFNNKNILEERFLENGLKIVLCRALAWDYVTEIGEFLFLMCGCFLAYRIRNAKKEIYQEKFALTISISIETIVSMLTYLLRHALWTHEDLRPDHFLLLYFIRSHLTVSVMIVLLFAPKFFYKRPQRHGNHPHHHRSRHLSSAEVSDTIPDSINIHSAILSNGEIDIGEINLTDMDPEDIRAELRRVYTQLQVLKNKTVRKDNPHISKRRGGRKSHRRFSLQHFHHKHKHEQEVTEISRTPEESTASMDGATSCMPDGPSIGCRLSEAAEAAVASSSNRHRHS